MCCATQSSVGMGMDVCAIIKQIYSGQLLVCMCVMEKTPGSAIKEAPRDVCVCLFVHT